MRSQISKALLSNLLIRSCHLPKSSSSSLLHHGDFSTVANRPMRGDRSGGGGGGETEPDFRRNRNFRDGERGRGEPNRRYPRSDQQRPMRGERRDRGTAGGSRESGEKMVGGEMDESDDSLLKILDIGDVGSEKKAEETPENPPVEVPTADDPAPEGAQPQDADEIFKKMKEVGLVPQAVAMLDGLCKDGLVQEAMKLFGLMREKGTFPDVVVYTAVVEAFCKAAKFDDAKRVFRKMQKNGVVPNAFSYGVVIRGLCKGKRLEDAAEFSTEMLEAGHAPNPATLAGLVSEFCHEKGGEEAEGFVRRLREKGFAIDEKAVTDYLDKKGPYSPMVWEAIFGKRNYRSPF